MNWERRPKADEPRMVHRSLRDDQGRTWTGLVQSGRHEGGEELAEVLFICEDQPGETKRVARLDTPAASADERWQAMGDQEVAELFRSSEPA